MEFPTDVYIPYQKPIQQEREAIDRLLLLASLEQIE
jgi:hypothetical protein